MKRAENGEDLIFETTGREVYCNQGIVGIGPDPEEHGLHEGYDGNVRGSRSDDRDPFTPEERAELGQFMIDQWTAWMHRSVKQG